MNFGLLTAKICWRVWAPFRFQRLSRLGSVTATNSSSGRQADFAALNRGHHLYSAAERPSRLTLAHILVISIKHNFIWTASLRVNFDYSQVFVIVQYFSIIPISSILFNIPFLNSSSLTQIPKRSTHFLYFFSYGILTNFHYFRQHSFAFFVSSMPASHRYPMTYLWPPCIAGCGHIYFHPVVSSFFLFLFPRLISAVGHWMSTILPHMVWP